MLVNPIHCAIVGSVPKGPVFDYVPPEYSEQGMTHNERVVRAAVLGGEVTREESRNYTSTIIRDWLRNSQLRSIADVFGIEGGYAIEDLRRTLFESYRPAIVGPLNLSNNAVTLRTEHFVTHSVTCTASGGSVIVENAGFGSSQGDVGEAIAIPGLADSATLTVTKDDSSASAVWSTGPSIEISKVITYLREDARSSVRDLSSINGPLSLEVRSALYTAVVEAPIAIEKLCAAVLLLTNAVVARVDA